jgi:hypothetical protein
LGENLSRQGLDIQVSVFRGLGKQVSLFKGAVCEGEAFHLAFDFISLAKRRFAW